MHAYIHPHTGDVVYTIDEFLEKNRDTLTQDILTVMEGSGCQLAALLFKETRTEHEKAKRPPTISTQFRRQVRGEERERMAETDG